MISEQNGKPGGPNLDSPLYAYFCIALLKAAALKVRVVFGFLKQHPMPIHFIPSQIHAADHGNHTYFALKCHLEGEI